MKDNRPVFIYHDGKIGAPMWWLPTCGVKWYWKDMLYGNWALDPGDPDERTFLWAKMLWYGVRAQRRCERNVLWRLYYYIQRKLV